MFDAVENITYLLALDPLFFRCLFEAPVFIVVKVFIRELFFETWMNRSDRFESKELSADSDLDHCNFDLIQDSLRWLDNPCFVHQLLNQFIFGCNLVVR